MPGNFMVKGDTMRLIDFEFCGDNEATYELGLFFCEMFYDDEDMLPLIEAYYGQVRREELARIRVSRVMGDLKWGMGASSTRRCATWRSTTGNTAYGSSCARSRTSAPSIERMRARHLSAWPDDIR